MSHRAPIIPEASLPVMVRAFVLQIVFCVCGCASLTPEGGRVKVYQAPLDQVPAQRPMPSGCRLLSTTPPRSISELDLTGQKDPFRAERNAAAAAGGNALLVLTRMTMSRHDLECPGSSPITDCPPSVGAWYDLQIETYACPPDALRTLTKVAPALSSVVREEFMR